MTLGELVQQLTDTLENAPDSRDAPVFFDAGGWVHRVDVVALDFDGDVMLGQTPYA